MLIVARGNPPSPALKQITTNTIPHFFERTKYSLNEVSHDTAIGLINLLLTNNINVHEVGI